MQTLSKDQVALRLQAPNGAAALMEQAEAALEGALALFLEDQDPAACGFLCRCAKSNRLRQQIQAALSVHPEALGQALFAPVPKLRKNAAPVNISGKQHRRVHHLRHAHVDDIVFL